MTAKKRTSPRRARKSSASTKRSTPKSPPKISPAQKSLMERLTPPWERIIAAGIDNPVPYDIPWDLRGMTRGMTTISGVGPINSGPKDGLEIFQSKQYSWSDYCTRRAGGSPPVPGRSSFTDYVLRPEQSEDVNTVLAAREAGSPEFLIANGTGTGKTVVAWSAVKSMHPSSVLIVCPVAVIPSWRQHVQDMGDDNIDVVIINYESLKKTIKPSKKAIESKKTSTQNKNLAMHGTPYEEFEVVVFDESHKLRNPTSQQSHICSSYAHSAKFVLRLTATPGKDPSQLWYLHRGLEYATGDTVGQSMEDYVSFCRRHGVTGLVPAPFGNGLSFEGSTKDIESMEKMLYGGDIPWGIKRSMSAAVVRDPLALELSPESRDAYEMLVEDARREIVDGSSRARRDMSKGLAAMVRLRQKTGILKAPHIVEYVDYCLQDLDEQVVVSSIYHATADTLSELLDRKNIAHVVITGRDSAQDKEHKRIQFQTGEVKVVITSTTEGVNLHSGEESSGATETPRRMVIADLNFSSTGHVQVEGRINRNGRYGVVTIPYLDGTIDSRVTATLLEGLRNHSILQSTGESEELMLLATALGINLSQ